MTRNTMKSLLLTAAMTGLMAGATTTLSASTGTANTGANSLTRALGISAGFDGQQTDKHACKGQNSCKGKGGCKSGDNGCSGKNSCKGKGGCATDGSKKFV